MKKLLLALTLFQASSSFAVGTILVKAPGSSPVAFADILKKDGHGQAYVDFQIEKVKNNPRQEESLFSLGEKIDMSVPFLLSSLDRIEASAPLTATSLLYVKDLSEKILSRTTTKDEKAKLENYYCKVVALSQNDLGRGCKSIKVSSNEVHRLWPAAEKLLIESEVVDLSEESYREVSLGGKYHWALLSNSTKTISFWGTYEELLQQHFAFENLIDGSCSGFTTNADDFELQAKGLVYFNETCIRKMSMPDDRTSFSTWIDKNKAWVYPLGAVVVGGALYSLKDTHVIIDKPNL